MMLIRLLSKAARIERRQSSSLAPVQLAYTSYDAPNPTEPPLIVNHGVFGSKGNWNSLCKAYSAKLRRNVVAVDARNHGDSPHANEHTYEHMVSDLKELLTRLKFEKVALLGHSMGGRVVMSFALKYPEIVERMIVVDISPLTNSPNLTSMPKLMEALREIELPKGVSMSQARAAVDLELEKRVKERSLRSFLLTNLVQRSGGSYGWKINLPVIVEHFDQIGRFPVSKGAKYEGPALFIGGEESDFLPKNDQSGILEIFPKAVFRYVKDAGHWVHSEKPAEFLKHTVEFLSQ